MDNIKYTAFDAINRASELGFDVIAITCHRKVIFSDDIEEHAKSKNVTVIPGIEASIEGKDVLILNVEANFDINSFEELRNYKSSHPDCLVIAPHPFHVAPVSLMGKLKKNIDIFDAVEWSYFYSKLINPNKRVKKLQLPIIGTSDVHNLDYFDPTYCEIESKSKKIPDIIEAIKQNKVELKTKPYPTFKLFHLLWVLWKSTH